MRRLFIDSVENMRDIGGYPIGNTKIVKEGKLFRSNCVTELADEKIKELSKIGINRIIDLRSDEEIQKKKGVFVGNDVFVYKHIRINGDGKLPEDKDKVLDSYIEMLQGKEQIRCIFDILADDDTDGVLYYCNAGKDRTGVITACILKFLGVDDKDIIVDYLASGVFLKEMIEDYASSVKDKDIYSIINPNYDNMYNLLKYIEDNYGGIESYLKSCNISEKNLEIIKNKYTQYIKIDR